MPTIIDNLDRGLLHEIPHHRLSFSTMGSVIVGSSRLWTHRCHLAVQNCLLGFLRSKSQNEITNYIMFDLASGA